MSTTRRVRRWAPASTFIVSIRLACRLFAASSWCADMRCAPVTKPTGPRHHGSASVLGVRLVGITEQRSFTGLCRSDDRMLRSMGVLGRVLVRRAVAAQRRAASLACPKVNPRGVDLHAFLARLPLRGLH